MTEVPPAERTAPRSLEEISDATLDALRCAAVAHAQDRVVDNIDREQQRREKRHLRR